MKKILLLIVVIACTSFTYQARYNKPFYKGLICAWSFDHVGNNVSKIKTTDVLYQYNNPLVTNNTLKSDGASTYYELPLGSSLNNLTTNLTVSFWCTRSSASSGTGVYTVNSGGVYSCWNASMTTSGRMQGYFQKSTTTGDYGLVQSATDYTALNIWYHCVMVYDGNQAASNDRVKIYVNGKQITSGLVYTSTFPTTIFNPTSSLTRMGRGIGYVQSLLNEPEIWNRSLTAGEVLQLYNYEKNFIR